MQSSIRIEVFNDLGQCLLKLDRTDVSMDKIDMSNFEPGPYLLKIVNDKKQLTSVVIKR